MSSVAEIRMADAIRGCVAAAICAVCISIFTFSCAPAVFIDKNEINRIISPVSSVGPPPAFKGAGNVRIAINEERATGGFTLNKENPDLIHADIYSPFGTITGTIQVDGNGGEMRYNDKTTAFSLDQTMDSLPFRWGKHVTFREFGHYITCRIPHKPIFREPPDTIIGKRHKNIAYWKTDSFTVAVTVGSRERNVANIIFMFTDPANGTDRWQLRFSEFKQDLPYSISMMDNEKNYFSIIYDKIIAKR